MLLCMRTTVDVPDALLKRARPVLARKGLTLRAVVIDALERLLAPDAAEAFRLRDASAGYSPGAGAHVSNEEINRTIDDVREPTR